MNKKMLELFSNNRERYRDLCAKEPSICIFLKDYWQDAVCEKGQWSAAFYEKGGHIYGSLVFCYKVCFSGIVVEQPPLTQTGGIWIRPFAGKNDYKRLEYEKEIMSALIAELEKLPIIRYSQNFTVDITNWLPFYWKGFQQTTRYTYRIMDISDPESVVASFSSGKRGNLNRAQKTGLQIKYDLTAQELYQNHVLSLGKQGKQIVYSFDLLKRIVDTVYAHECGKTIGAVDENGNIHAILLIVWDSNCGFYLINSVDPEFRSSGAAALLVAEIVRYLSAKGVKQFDFEGSMIEPVEKSYRQFGTKQLPYFTISRYFHKNSLERGFCLTELFVWKCIRKGKRILGQKHKA